MTAYAIDLDVLGDTRPLWRDWLVEAERVLGVDPAALSEDRAVAADELDRAGAGNWRTLLGRFAEDRAPVYLRPSAEATTALRSFGVARARVGLFTDAPEELATVAAAHVGASGRVEAIEAGAGALERLAERMGVELSAVHTRAQLLEAATAVQADARP